VDGHARFRQAAFAELRRHGFECDALGHAGEAAALLERGTHDVLVLDVGSAANRRLLLAAPGPPVVAVTRRPSVESALAALRVRAVDYLTPPIRAPVLVRSVQLALEKANAVRGVRRAERLITLWAEWVRLLDAILTAPGRASLPTRLLAAMAREGPRHDGDAGWHTATGVLSPREQEVLLAFGAGLRVQQIARTLGVSVHTARAHLKAIMRKLNVHSQTALLDRLREDPAARGDAKEDRT
jgi:two-component system nitrate/nitrite response regulator NarL